jgi:hypothetical protein
VYGGSRSALEADPCSALYAHPPAAMPRAKPSLSGYCASRHLLRNLDDARELRRNQLAAGYFCSPSRSRRRTPDEDRRSLERICGLVREALGALYAEREDDRDGARLGRMHAALLRCEIDRQPPELVAAELGLSERQLRRERSAAHDAFLRSFRRVADAEHLPAIVGADIAQLRLAEAVELHAIGKSSLGLSVFASIAATAPHTATRIEALCLATEAELDAGRLAEAQTLVAEVNAVVALHGDKLCESDQALFAEHVEYLEWSLRWQFGIGAGAAMRPPSIVTDLRARNDPSEGRRALCARALAAFASQRWEVGDVQQGREAVRVGQNALPSLRGRVKERLALMHVDAQLSALRSGPADGGHPQFLAAEQLAAKAGHVRPLLATRAERLGIEAERTQHPDRSFDDLLSAFARTERSSMSRTLGHVACVIVQWERDAIRGARAADIAEELPPSGSTTRLLARAMRSQRAIATGRHAEARALAEGVRSDAARIGNNRLRGSAERDLATIALLQGRPRDARRLIRDALPALERYGSRIALADAFAIARRLGVN